jgi:hypothetical protein
MFCVLTESTFIIITHFSEMSTPFLKKIKLFLKNFLEESIAILYRFGII